MQSPASVCSEYGFCQRIWRSKTSAHVHGTVPMRWSICSAIRQVINGVGQPRRSAGTVPPGATYDIFVDLVSGATGCIRISGRYATMPDRVPAHVSGSALGSSARPRRHRYRHSPLRIFHPGLIAPTSTSVMRDALLGRKTNAPLPPL